MTLTRELEGMKRNSISGLCGELEEATLWVSSQFFIVKITLKLSSKQRNGLERVMLYYLKVEFSNSFWHEFSLSRKYPAITEVCSLNDWLSFFAWLLL